MVERKRGRRERSCIDCGKIDFVRQDNTAVRCVSCAGRLNARAGGGRAAMVRLQCATCSSNFERPRSVMRTGQKLSFCSMACRRGYAQVRRTCKFCGDGFSVSRSVLGGKTNGSGNFCSRPCYERWLCRTDRVSGRGSQWRKIRQEIMDRHPFCGWCGTLDRRRLQVHHIVPFRISNDNSPRNLIPLCRTCHRRIETVTVEVEALGVAAFGIFRVMSLQLRQRQAATSALLRRIANDNSKPGHERSVG